MDARKLTELQRKVEQAKMESIKAKASLEAAKQRLQELGYDTPEEAEKALTKLEKDVSKLDLEIEQDLDRFQEEYPDLW